MTLDEAIHEEIERSGRVSFTRRRELAEQYKVKPDIVRDEVNGAFRQLVEEMPDRLRIRAKLESAEKLARERRGYVVIDGQLVDYPAPDCGAVVRAIVADAQVCGLMKAATKKGDEAAPDHRPERDVWREALKECPRDLLLEVAQAVKGMH